MKNNFERFQELLANFFEQNGVDISINQISLHEASKNDADKHHINYFYNGEELSVIDMDMIAKSPYRDVRVLEEFEDTKDDIVNTADGFVINKDHATAADIVELMQQVSDRVEEKFGVKLEPEVKRLGEF